MLKRLSILVILFFSISFNGQELVNSFPLKLKSNQDVFQIIDDKNQETTLFISDKKKIYVFLLDQKLNEKDSLTIKRPDTQYKEIIGYTNENSNKSIFWSNKDRTKIFCVSLDFLTKKSDTLSLKLDLSQEKIIQNFSTPKKFFILTSVKNSNHLKLYVFRPNSPFEIKELDLSKYPSLLTYNKLKTNINFTGKESNILKKDPENVFDIFNNNSKFPESNWPLNKKMYDIEKITYESPTSLTESSQKIKAYCIDDNLILTFDNSSVVTQLLTINTDLYTTSFQEFNKPVLDAIETSNSNSFLYREKLFQIVLNAKKMIVSIKESNGNEIKKFEVLVTESIPFKNSQIIQKNATFSSVKILPNTEQFLKKVDKINLGLSCFDYKGKLFMTIGGVSNEKDSFMEISSINKYSNSINNTYTNGLNPIYNKFDAYMNRKVVSFDALFDLEYNVLHEKIENLAFDKISSFLTDNYTKVELVTIFVVNHDYYLGYFDNMSKNYVLKKYAD